VPLAAVRAVAATAPVPPSNGAAPGDPPNAQALHNVAMKAAQDHPDLVNGPGWEHLADYVKRFP
jgi:hypothetical protein